MDTAPPAQSCRARVQLAAGRAVVRPASTHLRPSRLRFTVAGWRRQCRWLTCLATACSSSTPRRTPAPWASRLARSLHEVLEGRVAPRERLEVLRWKGRYGSRDPPTIAPFLSEGAFLCHLDRPRTRPPRLAKPHAKHPTKATMGMADPVLGCGDAGVLWISPPPC